MEPYVDVHGLEALPHGRHRAADSAAVLEYCSMIPPNLLIKPLLYFNEIVLLLKILFGYDLDLAFSDVQQASELLVLTSHFLQIPLYLLLFQIILIEVTCDLRDVLALFREQIRHLSLQVNYHLRFVVLCSQELLEAL